MKKALVTFIYPEAVKYISDFKNCLQTQSAKDYTLVIFNDSLPNSASYFSDISVPFKIVDAKGTPTEVRFKAFEWLKNSEFEKIIFQDIDDQMSENRLECLSDLLDKYNLVANDLSLMDETGKVYAESIWGDRLGNEFMFSYKFISDKNILGIGNSAMRKNILNTSLSYSNIPLVADWFMYYQILFNGKTEAAFTTQCQTYYRQHASNMAGIKELTGERLEYVFKVKEHQYNALEEVGISMAQEKKMLKEQKKHLAELLNKNQATRNFFWWEETSNISKNGKINKN